MCLSLLRAISLLVCLAASLCAAPKTLDVYFIDVEGGQATLLVTPSGQSMLVDAGWPGFEDRDANRIAAAAKRAGIKRIDYMLVSHYHLDHVGGLAQLAAKLPIETVVTHGPNTETGKQGERMSEIFEQVAAKARQRLVVKTGDSIPLKSVDIRVVAARGETTDAAVPGGGQANPLCANATRKADDPSENARSIGFVAQYGKFRFVDLSDLTWNKEVELACPANPIGKVDVYLSTHHGMDASNAPTLVHALQPRVAIMNNGARKGGSPDAWKVIRSSPGLEDIWQIHFAMAGGKETNAPDSFVANLEEDPQGHYIKLSAREDGSFTVLNSRNKYTKTYPAR